MKHLAWCLSGLMIAGSVAAGQLAPDFELTDVNGQSHKLSDFTGKTIVLEWTNYDCPFVRKFYDVGKMQKWQEKYTGKDVVWLSINSSAPGKQGHFTPEVWQQKIDQQGVKATAVLLDPNGEVGRAYGAKTTPHMYVISEGKIVYQGAIDDKRSTNSDDIEGANNYVKAALKALMNGEAIEVAETQAYGCSVKY